MIQLIRLVQTFMIFLFVVSCTEKNENTNLTLKNQLTTKKQKEIITKYVDSCARNYSYYSNEWQQCLDKGLQEDSTIAYLWQQKAMPNFKARKYELGMRYLDKAVKYNEKEWLPYRAFIKCIFAKTYTEAIEDFKILKEKEGNQFVMDHTYDFYMALCYLQLNEFEKAEKLLENEIEAEVEKWGEEGYHHLDLFYYGISLYEQAKYEKAIEVFDKALSKYPKFSDVLYYKAIALSHLGEFDKAKEIYDLSKKEGEAGNTINEDNAVYEIYPYQVRW